MYCTVVVAHWHITSFTAFTSSHAIPNNVFVRCTSQNLSAWDALVLTVLWAVLKDEGMLAAAGGNLGNKGSVGRCFILYFESNVRHITESVSCQSAVNMSVPNRRKVTYLLSQG